MARKMKTRNGRPSKMDEEEVDEIASSSSTESDGDPAEEEGDAGGE